ncbi:hypothetical protein QYE76_044851 [Lolium multiflorum]|uniref:Uncharacterized protein n=1 Tax=Lolium multiflorum TaxID=4521 RepID=A0AAD8WZI7_LOLMU|nr:hypothetical protein QYE76_044851 [Lolium multiflorum]
MGGMAGMAAMGSMPMPTMGGMAGMGGFGGMAGIRGPSYGGVFGDGRLGEWCPSTEFFPPTAVALRCPHRSLPGGDHRGPPRSRCPGRSASSWPIPTAATAGSLVADAASSSRHRAAPPLPLSVISGSGHTSAPGVPLLRSRPPSSTGTLRNSSSAAATNATVAAAVLTLSLLFGGQAALAAAATHARRLHAPSLSAMWERPWPGSTSTPPDALPPVFPSVAVTASAWIAIRHVSAAVRLQAAARGLLVRRRVREMRDLLQLLQVALHCATDLDLVRCVVDLGRTVSPRAADMLFSRAATSKSAPSTSSGGEDMVSPSAPRSTVPPPAAARAPFLPLVSMGSRWLYRCTSDGRMVSTLCSGVNNKASQSISG